MRINFLDRNISRHIVMLKCQVEEGKKIEISSLVSNMSRLVFWILMGTMNSKLPSLKTSQKYLLDNLNLPSAKRFLQFQKSLLVPSGRDFGTLQLNKRKPFKKKPTKKVS